MTHYQAILLQTFVRFFVGIIKSYPHPVEKAEAKLSVVFSITYVKAILRSAEPISGGMSSRHAVLITT
jgi:hypothetical protein